MDLFGRLLLDHVRGVRGADVAIQRDDGYAYSHDPAVYFAAEPQGHEAAVLSDAAGPVLDLGCGAGRHLLWAARQGLEAAGIDASPGAVETARMRGAADVRLGDAMSADLDVGGQAPGTFLLFGNNLGMGGTAAGTRALLARLARHGGRGAHILLTSIDVAATDEPAHLAYHARNRAAGVPIGQIRIRLAYRDLVGPWFDWLHMGPAELEALAADAGWALGGVVEAGGGPYAAVLRRL